MGRWGRGWFEVKGRGLLVGAFGCALSLADKGLQYLEF
jgi:hypothetical protein